ncbi:MAG: cellulose synthase subunit BcsC-related outer membrane protein, partial [Pseudomonadota bacterium]
SQDLGGSGVYLNGEFAVIDGKAIDTNESLNLNGGLYVGLIQKPEESVTAGFNVTYLSYDENQRFFTLGHGGYFSPQDFISATVPIAYTKQTEQFDLKLDGAVGFQFFEEDAVVYFPNRGDLQALAAAEAGDQPIVYAAQSDTTIGLRAGVDMNYKVSPYIHVGGELSFNQTADFTEVVSLVRVRFWPGLASQ